MGDETSDPMNLDLNLGPATEPASVAMSDENLDSWIDQPIHRVAGVYGTLLQRWSLPDTRNVSSELNQMMVSSGVPSLLHEGEGSVAAEERSNNVVPKTCENVNGVLEIETLEEKDDVEKSRGSDGSFFDCNICLDLARDPVLTCCGHLFCWPCLYRWLHVHSDAKECPVCKGEVTLKNVTPIYGRGNIIREADDDTNLKIPLRPHARRVESLRQAIQRSAFSFPVDEMIRRLGSRFDLSRDSFHPTEELSRDSASERTSGLLNMILTSRALRREQAQVTPTEVVDLTQDNVTSFDTGENRRLQAVLLRRTQSHRATLSSLSSALSSAERLVEAYFHNHPSTPVLRSPEANPPVDDRDSYSSIQAVINSESQLDTAAEIDSMVSLSTSSSSRRNEASRVSDVDSGDSRAHRRRRLN